MSALPSNWHQPNTRYLVNHDIMSCTADEVLGNQLYSARGLAISEPWDVLQLHPSLQFEWEPITQHYDRIGLSHSTDVIWDLDLRSLHDQSDLEPSLFFYGIGEHQHWGDQAWLDTVDYINSKNSFMELADQLGVDVPQTLCFDSVHDIDVDALETMAYPCYLKAAISVAGVGIYRCQDQAELLNAMGRFGHDVPVQIQEEVNAVSFLNLQYQVIDGELIRLAASEQILDGFTHQGNRVPASHEPWDAVEPMAVWLKDHGIKGIFAFDVAIMQTERGLRFPAIECNPRFNGASYPTLIAQKLDIPEWIAITVTTRHRSLGSIDLRGLEFNRATGEGLVVVNWGTIMLGKMVVLIAGSRSYQEEAAMELAKRL